MAEVVGVRFKNVGKIYYFDPQGIRLDKNARVIVETARGIECGEVAMANREVPDETVVHPLKKVIRAATEADLAALESNREKEKKAAQICQQKIAEHKLDMKLVDVEYTFDNNKILFYFTADGRIDVRDLVKDLASVFRTRIELRQIGVRDEAKMLGGLGICGNPFCCHLFGRVSAGIHPHGQRAGAFAEPHQDLGHLRAADVLSEVRAGGLRGPDPHHPQGWGGGFDPRGQGLGYRGKPADRHAEGAPG